MKNLSSNYVSDKFPANCNAYKTTIYVDKYFMDYDAGIYHLYEYLSDNYLSGNKVCLQKVL